MIDMLAYDKNESELNAIYSIAKEQAAYMTNDVWHFNCCYEYREMLDYIKELVSLDAVCFDVTEAGAITALESLRKKFQSSYIIVVADKSISPVKYMKPSIMAASLMLRPLSKECVQETIKEMLSIFEMEDNSKNVFLVDDEDGRNRIPYNRILYFEAREKKVYVCTETEEYGFYGTIEKLAKKLPDNFVRCHRSYIVNVDYIVRTAISEGFTYLHEDFAIPVSRTYKDVMKAYKHGK